MAPRNCYSHCITKLQCESCVIWVHVDNHSSYRRHFLRAHTPYGEDARRKNQIAISNSNRLTNEDMIISCVFAILSDGEMNRVGRLQTNHGAMHWMTLFPHQTIITHSMFRFVDLLFGISSFPRFQFSVSSAPAERENTMKWIVGWNRRAHLQQIKI